MNDRATASESAFSLGFVTILAGIVVRHYSDDLALVVFIFGTAAVLLVTSAVFYVVEDDKRSAAWKRWRRNRRRQRERVASKFRMLYDDDVTSGSHGTWTPWSGDTDDAAAHDVNPTPRWEPVDVSDVPPKQWGKNRSGHRSLRATRSAENKMRHAQHQARKLQEYHEMKQRRDAEAPRVERGYGIRR
jgi:hypothetical protein